MYVFYVSTSYCIEQRSDPGYIFERGTCFQFLEQALFELNFRNKM